ESRGGRLHLPVAALQAALPRCSPPMQAGLCALLAVYLLMPPELGLWTPAPPPTAQWSA
ncbi:unnamed protein product, partial [Amoebophrya sp. A25]